MPTIELREDVYRDLKAERAPDETLSDVIERLLDERTEEHPLERLTGILDEEEADRVRARMAEFRRDLNERFDRGPN